MLEKALDKGNSVSAIFMNLSKTYDHDLLIAKLEPNGFSVKSLS